MRSTEHITENQGDIPIINPAKSTLFAEMMTGGVPVETVIFGSQKADKIEELVRLGSLGNALEEKRRFLNAEGQRIAREKVNTAQTQKDNQEKISGVMKEIAELEVVLPLLGISAQLDKLKKERDFWHEEYKMHLPGVGEMPHFLRQRNRVQVEIDRLEENIDTAVEIVGSRERFDELVELNKTEPNQTEQTPTATPVTKPFETAARDSNNGHEAGKTDNNPSVQAPEATSSTDTTKTPEEKTENIVTPDTEDKEEDPEDLLKTLKKPLLNRAWERVTSVRKRTWLNLGLVTSLIGGGVRVGFGADLNKIYEDLFAPHPGANAVVALPQEPDYGTAPVKPTEVVQVEPEPAPPVEALTVNNFVLDQPNKSLQDKNFALRKDGAEVNRSGINFSSLRQIAEQKLAENYFGIAGYDPQNPENKKEFDKQWQLDPSGNSKRIDVYIQFVRNHTPINAFIKIDSDTFASHWTNPLICGEDSDRATQERLKCERVIYTEPQNLGEFFLTNGQPY